MRAFLDTWVHDVGYTNEKLHAGILQRLIQRAAPDEQRAVLAALWADAASESLPDGPVGNLKIQREAPLHGHRLRLDLLVSFRVAGQRYNLAIELKVDSAPRTKQMADEWRGLGQDASKGRNALVLLCLGTSQVCHCGLPPGVRRWSVSTLLHHRALLSNALPRDPIVAGWIECLQSEEYRRTRALDPPRDQSDTNRTWSGDAYWLGLLQHELAKQNMLSLAPWHAKIHANGPVVTAEGSRRTMAQDGVHLRMLVEISCAGLYVKVSAKQDTKIIDPRRQTLAFFDELQKMLQSGAHAVPVERAKYKRGEYSSILKIKPGPRNDLAVSLQHVEAIGRVWAKLTRKHGWVRALPTPDETDADT